MRKGACGRQAKESTTMYWMGTHVAVYDLCVQMKVQEPRVKARARHRAKRRGKRSGARGTGRYRTVCKHGVVVSVRKCRRLVSARPLNSTPPCPQHDWSRASYGERRKQAYLDRLTRRLVELERERKLFSPRSQRGRSIVVGKSRLKARWIRASGFQPVLAKLQLVMACCQVMDGFEGLLFDSVYDSDDGVTAKMVAPLHPRGSRRVGLPPTRGRPSPRGASKAARKTRQFVGKPSTGKWQPTVVPERKQRGQVAKKRVFPCCGLPYRDEGRGHSKSCPNHSSRLAGAS